MWIFNQIVELFGIAFSFLFWIAVIMVVGSILDGLANSAIDNYKAIVARWNK